MLFPCFKCCVTVIYVSRKCDIFVLICVRVVSVEDMSWYTYLHIP